MFAISLQVEFVTVEFAGYGFFDSLTSLIVCIFVMEFSESH